MLKPILDFLKSSNYNVTTQGENLTVAFHKETKLVISVVSTNRVLVCHNTQDNMKFDGVIDNVQQLKTILNCIKKGL